MRRWADIDSSGRYRRVLGREPEHFPPTTLRCLLAIMLNPSTADGQTDDATIRTLYRFSQSFRCPRLLVCNLFDWRETSPKLLWKAEGPISSPRNDRAILECADSADLILVAWGSPSTSKPNRKRFEDRVSQVTKLISDTTLWCLGTTKDGQPRHPLYLPKHTQLQRWT